MNIICITKIKSKNKYAKDVFIEKAIVTGKDKLQIRGRNPNI
jgi:hypothetical protein